MDWASTIGLGMGILTFTGGILAWYRGSVEKSYAAQRDFGHLKRNQEQMASNLGTLLDELDIANNKTEILQKEMQSLTHQVGELNRTLIEMKAFLMRRTTQPD